MLRQQIALSLLFIYLWGFSFETRADLSCLQLFEPQTRLKALPYFQPFKIEPLIQRVDYRNNFDPATLDPSFDKLVFSREDILLLQEFELPVHRMKDEDRWVETDYGFALMSVSALRDWVLLGPIIRNPEASKRFIENIAKNRYSYPEGITPESADWIRSSLKINELAVKKAVNRLDPREDDHVNYFYFKIFLNQEYRTLVRQKEAFMFPIGSDMYLAKHEISLKDASAVLATLARFYLLNHLYVRGPDQGYYRPLADYIDKDSLMLLSRIPELLPSHPVFEAGHFAIDKESVRIGHDDGYLIASKMIFRTSARSNLQYEVHFVANAHPNDLRSPEADSMSGSFQIRFHDMAESTDGSLSPGDARKMRKIFAKEVDRMEYVIARKSTDFEALTGYRLPEATIVEQQESPYSNREFKVLFGSKKLPAHALTSFFVFASLH